MLFAQYVKARGIDHIEIEYIEYVSGNLQINVETGEISYEGQETEETSPESP